MFLLRVEPHKRLFINCTKIWRCQGVMSSKNILVVFGHFFSISCALRCSSFILIKSYFCFLKKKMD